MYQKFTILMCYYYYIFLAMKLRMCHRWTGSLLLVSLRKQTCLLCEPEILGNPYSSTIIVPSSPTFTTNSWAQDLWLNVPSDEINYLAQRHKCQDWNSNPHSADQKYQSLSPLLLTTAQPWHIKQLYESCVLVSLQKYCFNSVWENRL